MAPHTWRLYGCSHSCRHQVVQYTTELHTRSNFLQSVGVQPVYHGPQGRLLRYLLAIAALGSPAGLLLLWQLLQTATGAVAQ